MCVGGGYSTGRLSQRWLYGPVAGMEPCAWTCWLVSGAAACLPSPPVPALAAHGRCRSADHSRSPLPFPPLPNQLRATGSSCAACCPLTSLPLAPHPAQVPAALRAEHAAGGRAAGRQRARSAAAGGPCTAELRRAPHAHSAAARARRAAAGALARGHPHPGRCGTERLPRLPALPADLGRALARSWASSRLPAHPDHVRPPICTAGVERYL